MADAPALGRRHACRPRATRRSSTAEYEVRRRAKLLGRSRSRSTSALLVAILTGCGPRAALRAVRESADFASRSAGRRRCQCPGRGFDAMAGGAQFAAQHLDRIGFADQSSFEVTARGQVQIGSAGTRQAEVAATFNDRISTCSQRPDAPLAADPSIKLLHFGRLSITARLRKPIGPASTFVARRESDSCSENSRRPTPAHGTVQTVHRGLSKGTRTASQLVSLARPGAPVVLTRDSISSKRCDRSATMRWLQSAAASWGRHQSL